MHWGVSETRANALNDVCQLYKNQCSFSIRSARREFMPQLDAADMIRFANARKISKGELLKKAIKLSAPQWNILRDICPSCKFVMRDVECRRERINLNELTVTQNEANIAIVKNIMKEVQNFSYPTQLDEKIRFASWKNPLVISLNNRIIDGHHRFHAFQMLANANTTVNVIKICENHYDAMYVAYVLSKKSHSIGW